MQALPSFSVFLQSIQYEPTTTKSVGVPCTGPISTKTPTPRSTTKTPASIEKWLDPWALNADLMLAPWFQIVFKKYNTSVYALPPSIKALLPLFYASP